MDHKEILGLIGAAWSTFVCLDYVLSILKNKTKPHAFTWVIWSLINGIVTFAQFKQGAAAGTWPVAASAFGCFMIAVLSLFKGERNITKSDWWFFISGLAIISLWHATDNALLAVVFATLIDACAYYPTVRKSWSHPYEEKIFMYASDNFRWGFSLLASSDFSSTTLFYPLFCLVANNSLAVMIFWRRKIKGQVPA